jgi:hypothetical protein
MQSRMSSCRSSANNCDATEHETPAESSSAFRLLLHGDNQRLILGSSAVADQSFDARAGVLIPGQVAEIGSDPGLRRLCRTPFNSCGVEASSFDAVSAALPLEAAELAASRHKAHSYRHSHSLWPALVFGRAVVVQHFPCRRHGTSPN